MIKVIKHTPLHIYDETYMTNYYVSYGVPEELFRQSFKRIIRNDLSDFGFKVSTNGECFCCDNDNGRIIWIWTKDRTISTLSHEIMHAVIFTLNERIKLSEETDEVYCYQTQMLMRRILTNYGMDCQES